VDEVERPDVVVGRIVRPHGIRGQVVVESLTDFDERRFQAGGVLTVVQGERTGRVTIASSRPHGRRWVVGFEGVGSIDEAEAWRGAELRISDAELTPLPDGRFYLHDLIGCRVTTTDGVVVGEVQRVDDFNGPAMLLVVEMPGGEALVPFADTICRHVDIEAKTIVIAPPPGLLELNRKA
jgi:16S rRNA processing protein RimM